VQAVEVRDPALVVEHEGSIDAENPKIIDTFFHERKFLDAS
jgi:hypothetical protein